MSTTDTTRRRPLQGAAVDGAAPGWADPQLPAGPPRMARWLPLVLWAATLGVAIGLLVVLGDGRLAAPDLAAPGSWAAWAAGRDPLEVTMALVRLLGLGLAWYLVGVTSISVVARLCRAARLVRVADALSFGPVRAVTQQALGVTLAAGVVVTAVPATGWQDTAAPVAVETIAPLAGPPTPQALAVSTEGASSEVGPHEVAGLPVAGLPVPGVPAAPDTAVVTEPGPRIDSAPSPEAVPSPSASATPTAPEVAPPETAGRRVAAVRPVAEVVGGGRAVTVQPGDHFWELASADLATHLGREPDEGEVLAHWRDVVEANRDRLAVADNPDLLLPGQQVVLPPVQGTAP